MREHSQVEALGPDVGLALGAFDGLHRGHQALLAAAAESASELALVTFEPNPAAVLFPERAPPRLTSPSQRRRLCAALGVDHLVVLPFDAGVAATSPEDFVDRYLVAGLRPTVVVVGEDFRYGRGAAGDVHSLDAQLHAAGIRFVARAQVNDADGAKLGSSAIRSLVQVGEVEAAAAQLGFHYAVTGEVVHGEARGRDLGFPTANLRHENLPPASGVYAGWATIHRPGDPLHGLPQPAVANVGVNPTFADGDAPGPPTPRVEVHLIDAKLGERLYGCELEFACVTRLRPERRFDGVEALRAAIGEDVSRARLALAEQDPARCRPAPLPRSPRAEAPLTERSPR